MEIAEIKQQLFTINCDYYEKDIIIFIWIAVAGHPC